MKKRRLMTLCVTTFIAAGAAQAATLTWNDGSGDGQWNTTSLNWLDADTNQVAWTNGDDAIFNDTGRNAAISNGNYTVGEYTLKDGILHTFDTAVVTLAENITAGSVTFDCTGYSNDTRLYYAYLLQDNSGETLSFDSMALSNHIPVQFDVEFTGSGTLTNEGDGWARLNRDSPNWAGVFNGGKLYPFASEALGTSSLNVTGYIQTGNITELVVKIYGTVNMNGGRAGNDGNRSVWLFSGPVNLNTNSSWFGTNKPDRYVIIDDVLGGSLGSNDNFKLVTGLFEITENATINYEGGFILTTTQTGRAKLHINNGRNLTNRLIVDNTGESNREKFEAGIGLLGSATTGTYSGAITLEENDDGRFAILAKPGQTVTVTGDISGDGNDTGVDIKAEWYEEHDRGEPGGTVILTGTNTYTDRTHVENGTLLINGDHSAITSPVKVFAGATLGGTGTVGGAVTVDAEGVDVLGNPISKGTLAPGANAVGTLTVNSNVTVNGALALEVDGVAADQLNASGTIYLTNTTVTLDELSAPTETSYTLISAGTLIGTPSLPTAPTGYEFNQNTTSLTLDQTSDPFSAWAIVEGLTGDDALPGANPDGDNLNNLGEWYIGSDPKTADSSGSILSGVNMTGTSNFEYTHDRPVDRGNVLETYQWATDLNSWNDSGETANGTTVTITPVADDPDLNPDPDYESVTVHAAVSGTVPDVLFSRLVISKP